MFSRAVLLFGVVSSACLAQITGATLTGEVRDSSGSIIPNVRVTITNEATGIERTVASNDVGIYAAPQLPIGSYRLQAEVTGFKKAVREHVLVSVAQVVRIDFVLEVGAVTESITVEAAAPAIATETTSLGNLRYGQQIQTLPLNARGISGLYSLTAGVPVFGNGVNPQVAGYANTETGLHGTAYVIDGTVGNSPINANSGNVPSLNGRVIEQNMPNLESIAEFKFNTANNKAEFGQVSSISVATRSGGNVLHGSVFEYNRVGATSARSFFAPTRESLTRNQYGGSLGGPVYIPNVYDGRNRTFFFGAFEGFRDHRQFPVTGKFPNSREKAGDLSVIASRVPLRDPNGGTFPNNLIPASRIHPVTRGMLEFVPAPIGDQSASAPGAFNFSGAKAQIDHTDKFDVRLDHRFSDKDSISGRLTYSDNFNHWTNSSPLPNEIGLGLQDTLARQASLSETHIFNPNAINELRFGYWRKRRFVTVGLSDLNFLTGDRAIPGIQPVPPFSGLPSVTISSSLLGVTPSLFSASTTHRAAAEEALQVVESYSWIRGRHTFKFGADIRRIRINNFSVPNPAGAFDFTSSTAPATSATGEAFADFLLGLPRTSSWSTARDGYSRGWQTFFYAQDDFKATSRLSINYGLRWEYLGRLGEIRGRDANYDFSLRKVVVPREGRRFFLPQFVDNPLIVDAETVGLGSRLIEPDWNNFAPRIGLAYQPFTGGKTVLRLAYGVFYSNYSGFLNFQTAQGPPYNTNFSFNRTEALGAGGRPPSFNDPTATGGASANLLAPVNSVDRRYRDIYSQVWNFTIEQELARNLGVRTSYVGNKGTRLPRQVFANGCLPGTIACEARGPGQSPRADVNFPTTAGGLQTVGSSIYHSWEVEIEKRYDQGFFFNANYTHSKLIALSDRPADPLGNARLERGPPSNSITGVFHFNGIWDLPLARNRRSRLLGGWQIAGLLQIQSGQPFTVTAPGADTGTGSNVGRAHRVADGRLSSDRPKDEKLARYFDTAAFRRPARGEIGSGGVGILVGPGLWTTDVSLIKNTAITEQWRLQIRAEFFNLLNHANFGNPNADVTSSAFGRIGSTVGFPRQIQFGARLEF